MTRLLALLPLMAGCLAFHRGPMPGEPEAATYVEVDGVRVRYRDAGQGPAVVLLHGFASSLEAWERVTSALEPGHRVISLDLKGFGWTDRPEGDYSPDAQAKLVLGLLDRLGVDRAAVVGHSWGASVALAMALAAPERVTRLALYDVWAYEDQLPTFFVWARAGGLGESIFWLYYKERAEDRLSMAFFDQRFVTARLIDDVDRALERPGTVAAALAAVRGQRYAEWEARYKQVTQDTLLLWGREDRVTPLAIGERLVRQLPRAWLVSYPRCGHFPMLEAAAESTAELARFLDAGAGR